MSYNFLSIGIMGCTINEKYKGLQRGCCETWIPECEHVYIFCGNHQDYSFEKEMIDLSKGKCEFVHLEKVEEDYNSALYKQFLGIAHMMEHNPSKWYAIYGLDNYVHYQKVLDTLSKINMPGPLMVGGAIQCRTLDVQVPFSLGGGGIYVNHEAMMNIFSSWGGSLMQKARSLCEDWVDLCKRYYKLDYLPACDLTMGYYGWNNDIPLIGIRGFYAVDHRGGNPYYVKFSFNPENIIVCHFMSHAQMLEYHNGGEIGVNDARRVINFNYRNVSSTKSDIWEHLPVLREYALKSTTIAEMGVRSVVSTWAFLDGLMESGASCGKKLTCVDIVTPSNIDSVINLAKEVGIEMKFIQSDSAKVELEQVDILFIDTWHVYGHLKRELEAHADKVSRYIIMHDTTVDEWEGESIRCGMNIEQQSRLTGYPVSEITKGLWPAIVEFTETHKEWMVYKRYTNCNGLTILERIRN